MRATSIVYIILICSGTETFVRSEATRLKRMLSYFSVFVYNIRITTILLLTCIVYYLDIVYFLLTDR